MLYNLVLYLHTKGQYVCLFICLWVVDGRRNGWAETKLGTGTHADPRSVLVKVNVKVIYLCVQYNRIHVSATWRATMNHAQSISSSSSSSSAVAAATW